MHRFRISLCFTLVALVAGSAFAATPLPDYVPVAELSIDRAPPPTYPAEALATCARGTARVLIKVDAQGAVRKTSLDTSSGNRFLDAAAVQATRTWTFHPKRVEGQPQAGEAIVPVVFVDPCPMELAVEDPRVRTVLPPPGWDPKASPQGWAPYEDTRGRSAHPVATPKAALKACVGGVATLRVRVAANGVAADVALATSSGNADLDRAALDAARDWLYRPGKRGDLIVGGDVLVPVEFPPPC
jgi:TonB family protein